MTTFNLRVDPSGKPALGKIVEASVREHVIGSKPNPLPTLHVSTPDADHEPVRKVDVDFAPDNKGAKGAGTAGVMRGTQRGAF